MEISGEWDAHMQHVMQHHSLGKYYAVTMQWTQPESSRVVSSFFLALITEQHYWVNILNG